MNRSLVLLVSLLFFKSTSAQNGCTDPVANNYNTGATINDGTCTYDSTFLSTHFIGTLTPFAHESSGLVFTDGQMWTHNDSGNPPQLFKIDTATGQLLQTVYVDNYANNDWEDIAADSAYIYVGDFGNNNGDRTNLRILKILKSDIGTDTLVHVNAQAINFSYADQIDFTPSSNTDYNCEALIAIKDSLYIFTKQGNLQTHCYRLPKTPGTYSVSPYTGYNIKGRVTGAAYDEKTNTVALIGYEHLTTNSFIWLLYGFQGDMFFDANKRKFQIGDANTIWQTEGIEFVSDTELFISCESLLNTPAGLYTTVISNKRNTTNIAELTTQDDALNIYPNPTTDAVNVQCSLPIKQIELINATGTIISTYQYPAAQNKVSIDTKNTQLIAGAYLLKIVTSNGSFYKKLIRY